MKRFFLSAVAMTVLATPAFAAPPAPVQSPKQAPTQAPVQAPIQSPVQKGGATTASAGTGYRSYSYQPSSGYYYGSGRGSMGYPYSGFHSAGWKITGR